MAFGSDVRDVCLHSLVADVTDVRDVTFAFDLASAGFCGQDTSEVSSASAAAAGAAGGGG